MTRWCVCAIWLICMLKLSDALMCVRHNSSMRSHIDVDSRVTWFVDVCVRHDSSICLSYQTHWWVCDMTHPYTLVKSSQSCDMTHWCVRDMTHWCVRDMTDSYTLVIKQEPFIGIGKRRPQQFCRNVLLFVGRHCFTYLLAVCCSELQWITVNHVAVRCSELQWVAVTCSDLQWVAVSCSEL